MWAWLVQQMPIWAQAVSCVQAKGADTDAISLLAAPCTDHSVRDLLSMLDMRRPRAHPRRARLQLARPQTGAPARPRTPPGRPRAPPRMRPGRCAGLGIRDH